MMQGWLTINKTENAGVSTTTLYPALFDLKWLIRISAKIDFGCNHLWVSSLQNYLHKCKDTYFVRWNKYLCIYEDTFEQRYFWAKILTDDCILGLIILGLTGLIKVLPRLCLTLWHSITCIASSFKLRLQQQNIRRLPKNNNFRPDIFQPTASTSSSKVPGRTIGILLRVVGGFKKIISINIEILPVLMTTLAPPHGWVPTF